jgi:hypothetical protein
MRDNLVKFGGRCFWFKPQRGEMFIVRAAVKI